jgi:hypothetical protein
VTRATLTLWDSSHHLINVLAAAAPRRFTALAASNLLAHYFSLIYG